MSNNNEFRDAIATAIKTGPWRDMGDVSPADAATDILDTPEMQAIRAWLRSDAKNWCCDEFHDMEFAALGVPQSVIEWVLS